MMHLLSCLKSWSEDDQNDDDFESNEDLGKDADASCLLRWTDSKLLVFGRAITSSSHSNGLRNNKR
jgi:hypothetical protein